MIRYLEKAMLSQLYEFCSGDPFGCRIASLVLAYGVNTGFAQFWLQYTEDEQVCGAVSRLDGAVTVQASRQSDRDELRDFLSHIGYGTLVEEARREDSTGEVMEWKGGGESLRIQKLAFIEDPSLARVYNLLEQCRADDFQVPEFDNFYVDLSHRLRHHTAELAALEQGGKLLACGLSLWKTPEASVLGAIGVAPEARGRGLGSAVVLRLLEKQAGKKVFVFRANGKNQEFYQRLGFHHRTYFREG